MELKSTVEGIGKVVDFGGVAVIVGGIFLASALALRPLANESRPQQYRRFRQGIGRAILLGLEVLVAADIIRTVAVEPTFRSAGVLAVIVGIRTFLSFSLEVELEGRWPWQSQEGTRSQEAKA